MSFMNVSDATHFSFEGVSHFLFVGGTAVVPPISCSWRPQVNHVKLNPIALKSSGSQGWFLLDLIAVYN